MKKLMRALLLLLVTCGMMPVYAETVSVEPSSPVEKASPAKKDIEGKEKSNGMTLFLLVFIGAVLFVLSSASALNALGGRPPRKDGTTPPVKKKKSGDERDRFRL
ncbi:MAG: hypothetical protein P8171_23365 [Candidatus Thiodiazotropha sp.]